MKKTLLVAVMAMSCAALSAQERGRMSDEERAKNISERIEKSADRMAEDFNLKDDAKDAFIKCYSEYQKEMFATNQQQSQRMEQNIRTDDKKELSDEEATAKIKENFTRQEQQIATLQKRLEVQRKYCEELSKILTPQQVLKVLTPQRGERGQGGQGLRNQEQRRVGQGERRGNFEGGPRGGFGGGQRGGFGGPGGGF